ncbi:hypothetical protein [Novosphingobium sp. G106]|uniref:hypothetical protein n=1 Tax=Novosphingobium sp. G106 TaxID=2849500 RepID=UPI0020C24B7F|nr:hypothetical protein [Novosphingobium sp. G106]
MIDHSRQKNKKGTIPAFTPVPRHYNRHDGWTPERQRGFIEALADTGSVKSAAHAVNMTPEGAYLLRRHEQAGEFRKAWDAALACGVQRLEDIAMDRALNGVEVPVYSYGKLIGTRRKYNDRLLMFLLRNRAPKRFGEGGAHKENAYTRQQLEKLKAEWRHEWETEKRTESEAVVERLNRKLDLMAERRRADMSAEERRLEAELDAARKRRLALPGPAEADDDAADVEEADFEDAPAEPAAPTAPEEPASHRTVSIKHGWPDDGRATPFRGRW